MFLVRLFSGHTLVYQLILAVRALAANCVLFSVANAPGSGGLPPGIGSIEGAPGDSGFGGAGAAGGVLGVEVAA